VTKARIGILTAWASRANGGVFEAVAAHCDVVRRCGHEPQVFALVEPEADRDRARFGDTPVALFPVTGPAKIGFAPTLVAGLHAARLDLLHLHGIWMYPSHAGASWAARTRRPYLVSPHGMLDPWITGRGRLKKSAAKLAYERRSWRRATTFHALTAHEAAHISAVTRRRDDAVVIPNAGPDAIADAPTPRGSTVLYLGRIHPKKNVGTLVAAWRAARPVLKPLGARLEIAGWGAPEDVAALRAQLAAGRDDDIAFLGPVFGEVKERLIAGARFLALPSHSEGLPMVILEAWAKGTPVLMSSACNLPEGFAGGAAIDCGTGIESVATALRAAFALSDTEWRAKALAAGRFSPDAVTQAWQAAYARLLTRSTQRGPE
jgi:glycosyltransferase involved in cell wall biosynthesis